MYEDEETGEYVYYRSVLVKNGWIKEDDTEKTVRFKVVE